MAGRVSEGYGLAEKVLEAITNESYRPWWSRSLTEMEEAVVDVIRAADDHTGVLGGQGHIGCSLCRAVKRSRKIHGLE